MFVNIVLPVLSLITSIGSMVFALRCLLVRKPKWARTGAKEKKGNTIWIQKSISERRPDEKCVTTPDGGCIGIGCMHEYPPPGSTTSTLKNILPRPLRCPNPRSCEADQVCIYNCVKQVCKECGMRGQHKMSCDTGDIKAVADFQNEGFREINIFKKIELSELGDV